MQYIVRKTVADMLLKHKELLLADLGACELRAEGETLIETLALRLCPAPEDEEKRKQYQRAAIGMTDCGQSISADEMHVDEDAAVSPSCDGSSDGAYVQCWMWVPKDEL